MICLLLCSTAAAQYASDSQPVLFYDEAPIISDLQVDSGWIPSANAPIAIRLYIDTLGGIQTTLSGTSELTWTDVRGEPMLQRIVGEEDGTIVSLDAVFDFGIDVKLELPDVYEGTVTLANQEVEFVDVDTLDGMLLPGQPFDAQVSSDVQPASVQAAFEITPGIELAVGIGIAPTLDAELSGLDITTEALGEGHMQSLESQWVEVDPDPRGASEIGFISWWSGLLTADLDLNITPQVWVLSPAGNFQLAKLLFPVPLVDGSEIRTSEPAFYAHPLPLLEVNLSNYDFGEVPVGQTGVLEIPLGNAGDLLMIGHAAVDGSEDVAVFPVEVSAVPGGSDGVVVLFEPTDTGPMTADIVIQTSDPSEPEWIVQVQGYGVPGTSGGRFGIGYDGCNCGTTSPAALWWLPAVGLLAFRRRHS